MLDLNGILCACEPTWKARGFRNTDLRVHFAMMPTEVGKNFVWVRPSCFDFLSELSTFATITVWSSMLKSTTRDICSYLFGPSLVNPLRILGQEDCDRVPVRKVGNRMFYMKEVGTQKDIFLKTCRIISSIVLMVAILRLILLSSTIVQLSICLIYQRTSFCFPLGHMELMVLL